MPKGKDSDETRAKKKAGAVSRWSDRNAIKAAKEKEEEKEEAEKKENDS